MTENILLELVGNAKKLQTFVFEQYTSAVPLLIGGETLNKLRKIVYKRREKMKVNFVLTCRSIVDKMATLQTLKKMK